MTTAEQLIEAVIEGKLKKDSYLDIADITSMPKGSGFSWKNADWVVLDKGMAQTIDRSKKMSLADMQKTAEDNASKIWAKPMYFGITKKKGY